MSTKEFKRVPFAKFEQAQQTLGWSDKQISAELGYSDNTPSGWRIANKMPFVVSLALDALLAKHASKENVQLEVAIVVLTKNGIPVASFHVENPQRIQLNGIEFMLVPVK